MEELAEKLKLSEVLEKLWTHLIIDFITKLPVCCRLKTLELVQRLNLIPD